MRADKTSGKSKIKLDWTTQESDEMHRKEKLYYLNNAIDFKMDRTTEIRRKGTPFKDMLLKDMPSPTCEQNNST